MWLKNTGVGTCGGAEDRGTSGARGTGRRHRRKKMGRGSKRRKSGPPATSRWRFGTDATAPRVHSLAT